MDVLYWFQGLDGIPALALICVYFLSFALLLTFIGRRITKRLDVAHTPGSLSPAISQLGTMASILIGLVIVSLWGDYRAARATVGSEATEIRGATRVVQLLGGPSRPILLADLRHYVQTLTNDEWPAMQRGMSAPSAGYALGQLTLDVNRARTTSFDIRTRVNRIYELRTLRLSQMSSGIVWVLWLGLLIIPVFLLGGLGLLNDPKPGFHYLLVSLTAGALSFAIFVALELDLPFRGIAALSPAPISIAIDQALSELAPPTR
jgi:hypothetical protein